MQAHPPGPGLPRQDPSVMSDAFFILAKNYSREILTQV